MSNARSMRRKMAGVHGTSSRKKDPSKNLRRATRHATEALEGTLAGLADRFGQSIAAAADAAPEGDPEAQLEPLAELAEE